MVYVEPYPKSLTSELHKDAMVNDAVSAGKVAFQPFIGLAPRKYMHLFEAVVRKRSGGEVVEWDKRTAVPRDVPPSPLYIGDEVSDYSSFVDRLGATGISV